MHPKRVSGMTKQMYDTINCEMIKKKEGKEARKVELTIMTFNIHHGRGTDKILSLERIAEMIAQHPVDLVGLNEVDRHFSERSDYIDQISWLADRLQMDFAYGPAITLKKHVSRMTRQYGNALLSRYPISAITNHGFHFKTVENRSLLEVTVQINLQRIKVYVTHLSLEPITHWKQTTAILNKIELEQEPVILLGDWNMKPGARAWKRLTSHLQDAWQCGDDGPGYTFPSVNPKARLDYIFLSDHFRINTTKVVMDNPAASDHLPVITKVNTHFR